MEVQVKVQSQKKVQQVDSPQHKKSRKYQRKERTKKPRQQYNYDPNTITEDTEIDALPKKSELIPKPQFQDYKDQQKKNNEQINKLIEQKKNVRLENFKPDWTYEKGEKNKHEEFKNQISQAKDLRERLIKVKTDRNELRNKITAKINEAKQNNNDIKELERKKKGSKEILREELSILENKLVTKALTKEEEKNLNNQIMILQRKIDQAANSGDVDWKLEEAKQHREELNAVITELKEKKEPLETEYQQLKKKLDEKNEQITTLKTGMEGDKKEKKEQKDKNSEKWQQWKKEKKKKLNILQDKIQALTKENEKMWDDFEDKKQAYWKQKHYIEFIEWQTRIKNKKIYEKERDIKKKAAMEREKQREIIQSKQKFINQIQLCDFLIKYCQELKNTKPETSEHNEQAHEVNIEDALAVSQQWKKEKGLVVLHGKKSKEEDQPSKKPKKHRKRKDEKEKDAQKFFIPFTHQAMFESLKLIAPASIEELDAKIQQLSELEKLFQRMCIENPSEEDKKAVAELKAPKKRTAAETQGKGEQEYPAL